MPPLLIKISTSFLLIGRIIYLKNIATVFWGRAKTITVSRLKSRAKHALDSHTGSFKICTPLVAL